MPFIGKQSTANSKIKKSRFTATASQTLTLNTDYSGIQPGGGGTEIKLGTFIRTPP